MKDYHFRIYYEDTDAQGVVYYANYLKFFERARTEYLREVGYEQMKLMQEGIIFIVRSLELQLMKPAKLDDTVKVRTELSKLGKVSFDFKQTAYVNDSLITEANIKCGSLDSKTFIPSVLPEYIFNGMKKLLL
jgi:acyl-CoA thioester hydrolase